MSMSEFDRWLNSKGDEIYSPSSHEREVPPDFGEEDLAFAEELNSLFSPEGEELPPYFVQTLLAPEDPRFYPLEASFERKMSERVLRHLKLRRRLFHTPRSVVGGFITGMNGIYARRSLLASVAALMLIMLFTVAFTAPSFASGMEILLHGSHGGVLQVHRYPKVLSTPKHNTLKKDGPEVVTLLAAQQELHFKIYWPLSLPDNYSLDAIYLYQAADQAWANGPFIELVYGLTGVKSKGTGQIVIREFLPSEDVLQVVQDRAVHPIQVGQDGQPRAIYVDGQWVPRGKFLQENEWVYGGRSELIYQQDSVILWIAGDQRDGIDAHALWNIAQSLHPLPFNRLMLFGGEKAYVTRVPLGAERDAFATDVLAIYADDGSEDVYFISESSYQSAKPVLKLVTHDH